MPTIANQFDWQAWLWMHLQRRRRARRTGGLPPVPALPTGLKLWLNAEVTEALMTQEVGLWPDLSGNGNDAEQTNEFLQPTLQTTSFEGKTFPVVRFNATSNGMTTPLVIPTDGAFSIFALWCPAAGPSVTAVVSSATRDWTMGTYNGDMICYFGGWTAGATIPAGDFMLLEVRLTAGQDYGWAFLNGIKTAETGPGASTLSPLQITLGASGMNAYPACCDLAELMVWDRVLTDEEAAEVRAYFQGRYNYLKE